MYLETIEQVREAVGESRILHLRADYTGGRKTWLIVVEDRESPSMKRALLPKIADDALAEKVAQQANTGREAPLNQ